MRTCCFVVSLAIGIVITSATGVVAADLGTAFCYQGRLKAGGQPAHGPVDLRFTLYNAESGGSQVGQPQTVSNLAISDGLFTVELNGANEFGASAFNGQPRWLEIWVREPGGSFSVLEPRQAITAVPYALKVPGIDGHSLDAQDGSPVDALLVNAEGKVGVGTTTPLKALHVKGNGDLLALEGTDNTFIEWYPRGLASGRKAWTGFGGAASNDFELRNQIDGGHLIFNTTGLGNVGIGTASPSQKLEVAGDGKFTGGDLSLWSGSKAVTIRQDSADSVISNKANFGGNGAASNGMLLLNGEAGIRLRYGAAGTSGADALAVTNVGNVGIGTNSPQARAHVSSNSSVLALEGTDHAYVSWYPDGFAAGRKGYTGWPGATTSDFHVRNEIAGGDVVIGPGSGGSTVVTGAALEISSGVIRVPGASGNTPTAVFFHQVTSANKWNNGLTDQGTIIDNPMTNGDPNAFLFITLRDNPEYPDPYVYPTYQAYYSVSLQRWIVLLNDPLSEFEGGEQFNILVIKP